MRRETEHEEQEQEEEEGQCINSISHLPDSGQSIFRLTHAGSAADIRYCFVHHVLVPGGHQRDQRARAGNHSPYGVDDGQACAQGEGGSVTSREDAFVGKVKYRGIDREVRDSDGKSQPRILREAKRDGRSIVTEAWTDTGGRASVLTWHTACRGSAFERSEPVSDIRIYESSLRREALGMT